jgi:hypothetical protein
LPDGVHLDPYFDVSFDNVLDLGKSMFPEDYTADLDFVIRVPTQDMMSPAQRRRMLIRTSEDEALLHPWLPMFFEERVMPLLALMATVEGLAEAASSGGLDNVGGQFKWLGPAAAMVQLGDTASAHNLLQQRFDLSAPRFAGFRAVLGEHEGTRPSSESDRSHRS